MLRTGVVLLLLLAAALVVDAKIVRMPKKLERTQKVVAAAQAAHRAKEAVVPRVGRWDAHDPGYYTDDFARRKMFPLSAAAYADSPQDCLTRKFQNASVSLHIMAQCETGATTDNCAGYTAVSHSDKAIIVAFRGTEGFLQLVIEVDNVVLKSKKSSPIGGMIAEYFHDVFQHLWDKGIKDDVEQMLKTYPDYEVWITGHSLGGAVASIAATYILNTYNLENERIKLVTFGQPRTGDTDYASAHNLRLPRSYRVTHHRDIVPHVPPENFESYFHHESEVWYPQSMNAGDSFVVCNEAENANDCSDKQWFDVSISDHLHYFEKHLSSYGVDGCLDDQGF
ncbi:Lipase-3 domain-containing protein [Aphelenchoides fujianensis]|nr:Lipase-3 domain-containing protein [Aphelenchoides fujianensis]